MISAQQQLCVLADKATAPVNKVQTNTVVKRHYPFFAIHSNSNHSAGRQRVPTSSKNTAKKLQKVHHPFTKKEALDAKSLVHIVGPKCHIRPWQLEEASIRPGATLSASPGGQNKRLRYSLEALRVGSLPFSCNTSGSRHPKFVFEENGSTAFFVVCKHPKQRVNNSQGQKNHSPAKSKKGKFKPARYSELPQGKERSLLTPQYSAAQGIPHREPAQFRVWVQLMMAGPEHVLLAEKDDYIFQNGRRLVRPYFFEFVSHVSRRWAGQNIVELFSNEFRQRDRQYYFQAVEDGRLQVDGRKVPPSYVLKQGQTVVHFVHRHEPPVMDQPVTVLHWDADVVVVRKPASLPVHPCGQYRKNTVLGILQADHPELGTLSPIHRLDRLVSGLLIFARNSATADRFRQDIEANAVQKEYVARVVGVFPEEPVEANVPLLYDGKEGRSVVELAEELNDPAVIASAIVNGGRSREAVTRFRRLSTNGATSIVACQPLTGRTHQIRVHLQYLGHPIANDFLYLYSGPLPEEARKKGGDTTADVAAARGAAKLAAGATVKGSALVGAIRVVVAAKARKAREDEALRKRSESGEGNATQSRGADGGQEERGSIRTEEKGRQDRELVEVVEPEALGAHSVSNGVAQDTGVNGSSSEVEGTLVDGKRPTQAATSDALFEVDPYCTNCPSIGPSGYEEDQEGLWLHCVRYTGKTWSYECPLPDWAKLD